MSTKTQLIKELRNRTGAGVLDCREAILNSGSDIEKSIIWLRKKGLASVHRKAIRDAREGVISIVHDNYSATIIELNSETDFVSKNKKFLDLADFIVKRGHRFYNNNLKQFLASYNDDSISIQQHIDQHIALFGENIVLKKVHKLHVHDKGKIISYLHQKLSHNAGKIGVLVALEGDINNEIEQFGKNVAMHIAALKPLGLSIESIDKVIVNNEKTILTEQVLRSKKNSNIIEKVISGKMKKFFDQVVLLEQKFVIDGKTKVNEAIRDLQLKHNCVFNISGYVRYEAGI